MSEQKSYRLTVPVKCHRFRDEEKLQKVLAKQDVTTMVPVHTIQDVLLRPNATTKHGFRFSTFAMQQLCSCIAPGLSQVVLSLSKDKPGRKLAIKILNATTRYQWAKLGGSRLLVDRRAKRVDGIVGPRYQLLSNADLFTQCREMALDMHAVFHEAILEGRRLLLRYRKGAPLVQIPVTVGGKDTRQGFITGWHFSNSEVGDRSMNVAPLLIRDGSYYAAMPCPSRVQRLVHIKGPDFSGKVSELLSRLRGKALDMQALRAALIRISKTPLGLAGPTLEELNKHKAALVAKLVKGKLPARLAEKVVDRVLLHGSERNKVLPAVDLLRTSVLERGKNRTVYDLFSSLIGLAVSQDIKSREKLEQLAYRLLVKSFTI